eukprot:2336068-Alexandrium_andersonii.AAC.2
MHVRPTHKYPTAPRARFLPTSIRTPGRAPHSSVRHTAPASHPSHQYSRLLGVTCTRIQCVRVSSQKSPMVSKLST